MLSLDHITVISPRLGDGVQHVKECLGVEVPFGTRHDYMGTHNHRVQLGGRVYLEIVSGDPDGTRPERPRWFGLDIPETVVEDWQEGRRLRGWVAATPSIESMVARHPEFGQVVPLPFTEPEFAFAIPADGSLPMDGVLPSLIDHRDDPTSMADIPDLGLRLVSLTIRHPKPEKVEAVYRDLDIDRPPMLREGPTFSYEATIDTPNGLRNLW